MDAAAEAMSNEEEEESEDEEDEEDDDEGEGEEGGGDGEGGEETEAFEEVVEVSKGTHACGTIISLGKRKGNPPCIRRLRLGRRPQDG